MKTLSTPINTELAKDQSGWYEVYDFYLPAAVVMPYYGSTSIVRVTNNARALTVGVSGKVDYVPSISPEPSANWGSQDVYIYWNIQREAVQSSGKFQNDKMGIALSNVSGEIATFISQVDWDSVKVVVRKMNSAIAAPTAADCVLLFSGSIDSCKIDLQQVSFVCSNDMGAFNVQLPRENMHPACRFNWGDDLCTALKFSASNYKSKTCAALCTTTSILSAGLTEDTLASTFESAPGGFTDQVDALSNASITTSSDTAAYVAEALTFTPRSSFGLGASQYEFRFNDTSKSLKVNQAIIFAASVMPTGLTAGVTYYIKSVTNAKYLVSATVGGAVIYPSTAGTAVTLDSVGDFRGYAVKASNAGFWKMATATDWGTNAQGYWQIPDAQAGIMNAALEPYIQFDFGSAKALKLWKLSSISGSREQLVRLVLIFSSTNASTWVFETFYEMPPVGDTLFDVHIPNGSSARYWRICIRTRWAETYRTELLATVKAYAGSTNYWRTGFVTFDATTATAALQGLSFPVFASFAGELIVGEMPVAPAAGDTFKIERGCARSFNDCCERKNTENFGGMDSMPFETVVR